MTSRSLVAFAFAALLAPTLAAGEPATIRQFEAKAHGSADVASPVLHVFAEGAQVSVSETSEGGWRRIRLPDGSAAFILESALAFPVSLSSPSAEPPAAPAPPPPAPAPDLRPRIYVKDLDHFAELVKEDPELAASAKSLAGRRKQALVVGTIGTLGGMALGIGGVARLVSDTNNDPGTPGFGERSSNAGPAMMVAGLGIAIGAGIWAVVRHPKGADFLDVVNGWNSRHPDRQFTLERGGVDLEGQRAGAGSSGR